MSKPKIICCALCALLFALCVSVQAQQPKQVPRIGFLTTSPSSTFPDRIEAFRQGLRELGYIEGKSIVIEWRYSEGKNDRLPALAAELVRLKVDVIVAGGPTIIVFLKKATSAIPIVMVYHTDPVGTGLVSSLARPGGNITGLSRSNVDLTAKRLEILHETVPKAGRIAVLLNPEGRVPILALKEAQATASLSKCKLRTISRAPSERR